MSLELVAQPLGSRVETRLDPCLPVTRRLDSSAVGGAAGIGLSRLAEPERTREAAKQFEAILVEHLLKTAREASQAEREEEKMAGSLTYLEMAEQHLARALAERGGLGIAKMILADIQKPAV